MYKPLPLPCPGVHHYSVDDDGDDEPAAVSVSRRWRRGAGAQHHHFDVEFWRRCVASCAVSQEINIPKNNDARN